MTTTACSDETGRRSGAVCTPRGNEAARHSRQGRKGVQVRRGDKAVSRNRRAGRERRQPHLTSPNSTSTQVSSVFNKRTSFHEVARRARSPRGHPSGHPLRGRGLLWRRLDRPLPLLRLRLEVVIQSLRAEEKQQEGAATAALTLDGSKAFVFQKQKGKRQQEGCRSEGSAIQH